MKQIQGKYNTAVIFSDTIEETAETQIIELCNQEAFADSKIRIMPDVHAGAGCVIGFSADMGDKVIPNIVGVDIGCGMLTVMLLGLEFELNVLDDIINLFVPSGFNTHQKPIVQYEKINELRCLDEVKNKDRILNSIGSLGGGNHFIEIDEDEHGNKYLVIHSGSRNLGKQVADIYQKKATENINGNGEYKKAREALISEYKAQGKQSEIGKALSALKKAHNRGAIKIPNELCYITGKDRADYLNDMEICQEYARINRATMASIILEKLFDKRLEEFVHMHTVHNYISFDDNVIRKGAISAKENEALLIPINMRDGSILALGKGNEDWNNTAPHGAGRIMSRRQAKDNIDINEFKESMKGIYSSSVSVETIDEAPMAYKGIDEILKHVGETIKEIKILKPIYNFKAH